MRNHVCTGITSQCHLHFFLKSHTHQFFCLLCDWFQYLVFIPATSDKIPYCHKCRYPDGTTLCQHDNRFFIHIIAMLQTVHSGLDRCSASIYTICVTHDCKSFFMCDMDHFSDLFSLKRCPRHFSMILKIKQSCCHDLDKIRSGCFCFQNSLVKLFQIIKSTTHNGSVVSVFMDSKNRCTIINSIFRSKLRGKLGDTIWVSSISYK